MPMKRQRLVPVMAGFPAIHVFREACRKDVDARDKRGMTVLRMPRADNAH